MTLRNQTIEHIFLFKHEATKHDENDNLRRNQNTVQDEIFTKKFP
jgi:hypothetical protein